MKVGDIFYSVMQKDNCPFEPPRITKFIVEKIDTAHSYPIVSTKTDKWGRHYAFRESQIHLTYEDALVEKKKIIEKIEKWEREKREQNRLCFEEQERKEKQRQIEHDKQVRKEAYEKIIKFINELAWEDVKYDAYQSTMGEFPGSPSAIPRYAKKYFDLWEEMFNEKLEQIEKE